MKLPVITREPGDVLKAAMIAVLTVAFIFGVTLLLGCDGFREKPLAPNQVRIGDQTITAPAGATVEFEQDTDQSQGAGVEKREGNASGTGAGLVTDSQDAVTAFNASAPSSWLPGIGSTGGSADIESTLTGKKATSPLLWAGILAALGGAVAFYFGLKRAALVCFGLAGAFIAASFVPAWAWIILSLAGVGAVCFYVWAERKNLMNHEALRAVVAGVESLDTVARGITKSAIAVHADERDRNTIKAIKKADDLPSERA